jgi:hypothetical protein
VRWSKSCRAKEQIRDRSGTAAAIVPVSLICFARVPPDQKSLECLVTTRIRVSAPHRADFADKLLSAMRKEFGGHCCIEPKGVGGAE